MHSDKNKNDSPPLYVALEFIFMIKNIKNYPLIWKRGLKDVLNMI